MTLNSAADYRDPELVRKIGLEVLTKELGPLGMAYFIRQFDRGEGDYTREHHEALAGLTLEDVERQLKK